MGSRHPVEQNAAVHPVMEDLSHHRYYENQPSFDGPDGSNTGTIRFREYIRKWARNIGAETCMS